MPSDRGVQQQNDTHLKLVNLLMLPPSPVTLQQGGAHVLHISNSSLGPVLLGLPICH